ncbi:MAG: Ig-like domain-containing protein [Duncaniella sp.]|nr:Ig-like domain-containing protein [Duncaniella sp.]
MILNSATTVSYIPKFTAGQSFTFKVSDPNVRIMGIGASPVSSATALVTFGDKTTCTTGTTDKTYWSADDEYGAEKVTFTVLDDKEVSGLIYWTPKMYRYATPELVLSDTELDGTAGESKQLSLDVANKDTEKVLPAITVWTSADPAIAKVDADGLVTYVSKGSTEITADYNGTKAVCKVNVLGQTAIDSIGTDAANAPAEYFNLQGIRVDASALTPGVYIVRKGNEINKVVIK